MSFVSHLPRPFARGRRLGAASVIVIAVALAGTAARGQQAPDEALREAYLSAEAAFRDQRLGEAAEGYAKLAELTPGTAEVHAKLGLIHYLQGRFEEAVPSLRKALELKPSLPSVKPLLAVSLSGAGRHSEAVPDLEAGFADPSNGDLRRLIGLELQRSYVALDWTDQAARVVGELGKAYPDDPEVLYHVGRFHADMATAAMQKLLEVAPESVWGHQASGDALESLGNHALAIVEYQKALEKQPNQPGVHYSIGMAIQSSAGAAGDDEDAMEAFRQELRVDPSNALAAYELGEILRKRAQLEEARMYFLQAVDSRPEFGLGRIGLGRVLRELERPDQARPHLEKAVEVAPENEVARYQLALVYRALGDIGAAEREMGEFQRLQDEAK